MAGSAIPLSLLAKGIGQIVSNGHEKLEVYLEPEDYYNLKTSSKPYDVAPTYDHNDDRESTFGVPMPIHKTFVTRKGALLIFSEELANKAIAEQAQRLGLTNAHPKPRHEVAKEASHDDTNDDVESLRTVHDLSWAILTYGSKPEYRKKGEDLFMRFIHESNKTHPERRIRPGFSPTRYISTWSKNWNESLLQKLRTDGMISDKTLYRQNPVLPHLYQPTSYNLSSVPGPYRVTKTMLKNVPMMDAHRYKQTSEPTEEFRRRREEPEEHDYEFYKKQKDPPPSHQESEEKKNAQFGPIEAVKFLQTGQIEEVKYSELRPREKKEILAELLASAYEQQKHIQETLELVLASQKPRSTRSGASSSPASELMVDMHRAIMTLVESPVRKQIIEKQKLVQNEKEMRKREREKKKMEKEEIKKQRRAEKEHARLEKEMNVKKSHEDQVKLEKEKRRMEREKRRELRRLDKEEQKAVQLKAEQERLEQENLRKLERRERHRRRREEEDARKRQEEDVPVASQRRRSERETGNQFQNVEREPEERRRLQQVEAQDLNAAGGDILPNRQIATAERNHLKEAFLSANMKVPQAPANTPAQANTYVKNRKHKPAHDVQYVERAPQAPQEVVVSQKQKVASKKVQLYEEAPDDYEGKSYTQAAPKKRESLRESGEEVSFGYQRKPSLTSRPSQESLHSTVQQKAFVIPNLQSNKSSSSNASKSNYYAGALPISSNIVKQTLVDKVSLLSLNKSAQDEKSESYKSSVSEAKQLYRSDVVQERTQERRPPHPASHHVPHIGVEPATPMQKDLFASPVNVNLPAPKKSHLTPLASSKYSDDEESKKYSEESSILSSKSSKSSKSKQASRISKSTTTTASNRKFRAFNTLPDIEPNYATLKGAKGPGSQVSSSYLKSSDGKSTYSKGSRGNLPKKLQEVGSAAVFMPGNKVLSVGKSISTYSDTLPSITTEEEDAHVPPAAELPEESTEKDLSKTTKSLSESSSYVTSKKTSQKSSAKGGGSERRVSFKEDVSEKSGAPSSYKKSSARESETEEETEWEETEESADEWPDVQSEKSSKIAKKVASMVVAENRPDSNLEEDALKAAELWNSIAQEEDEETEYEESESATAEDSEAAFRVAAQEQEKKEMEVKAKLEEDRKKTLQEKNQREIIARKKTKSPSVKSAATSEKSSHTSAQESSISDVKSQLDVDVEVDVESESQITESSTKSKTKDADKRIPLSRGSSQTDKSSKISSSTKSVKKKLVVDVPKQSTSVKPRDSSSSPQRFKTPMSDVSSVISESRRSSIPADGADVQLGYNVTNYESKLGDPKPEEPIKTRNNIEPKKIKKTADAKSKPAKKAEVSAVETKQDVKKDKKTKENVQKTKKGKLAVEEASDVGESSDHSTATTQKDVKVKPPKGKPVKSEAKKKPSKERVPLDKPKKIAEKVTKTPETPFVAGRAKAEKVPADTEPIHPEELKHEPHPPTDESKRDMVTPKPKSKPASLKSKPATPQPSPKPQLQKAESVVEMKSEVVQDEVADDESEIFVTPSPAKSPEDDYDFVRVEEEEEEELPPPPEPEVEIKKPEDDQKSVKSDATAKTTQSNKTAEDQKSSQEDDAEKEAKLAAKRERENKRAAAADRRRIEVEKKRKEKEEQARKEREEQEREEQMKEQFEEEKKRREEAVRKKKEEAELEKQRELQEEENRKKREEAQRERERRQQEEKKKKLEEMQRRKREEEEKKQELARIKKEEEEQRRKEEEEMLAAMEDAEREEYQRIKREEEERLRIEAEERRLREEEEARIAMEQARLQAIIRAKQQAALEEKLKFVREFLTEANGLDQTQNVNRAYSFSYFELMQMLGLDAKDFSDEF